MIETAGHDLVSLVDLAPTLLAMAGGADGLRGCQGRSLVDVAAGNRTVIAESILEMPPPYLSGKEILGLQRVFPLYVKMPEWRYPEIERAEAFDGAGDAMFDALSAEFYEMTYGKDEADRMLTYAG